MTTEDKKRTELEKKSSIEGLKSRRKAVRAIVLGGGAVTGAKGLPSEWSAPLVNSVILPAHAETTDDSGSSGGGATTAAPTTTAQATTTTTTTTCPPGYYEWPGGICYSYPYTALPN